MNEIDADFLDRLAPHAALFLAAEDESGTPVGFLLAFGPGAPYDSENYRWFAARYDEFVYVDRVAVTGSARGAGIGRALYRELEDRMETEDDGRGAGTVLCCEVNLRPPNPGSLAFHRRLGFDVADEQDTLGGKKRVALMVRSGGGGTGPGGESDTRG